jgi:hypothetical protein
MKTEKPNACVKLNCKLCRSAIALFCLWSRVLNVYGAINPIIQSETPSEVTPTRGSMYVLLART